MMACAVPISFYGFLSKPRSFVQETCSREFTGGRILTPVTTNRGICAVNRSCIHVMILARNICEPISHHFSVSSSALVIISGFWVGPDIEDGWGFVEAVVNRI
ncbi:hypothetical protein ACH5RR_022979 [Cinchona calisaya]|uniref:Uncharacterized protein n=1 Tax=Cinchona calisaya TaxID=153742 RepID=A0ABD2ZD92_9GENT